MPRAAMSALDNRGMYRATLTTVKYTEIKFQATASNLFVRCRTWPLQLDGRRCRGYSECYCLKSILHVHIVMDFIIDGLSVDPRQAKTLRSLDILTHQISHRDRWTPEPWAHQVGYWCRHCRVCWDRNINHLLQVCLPWGSEVHTGSLESLRKGWRTM